MYTDESLSHSMAALHMAAEELLNMDVVPEGRSFINLAGSYAPVEVFRSQEDTVLTYGVFSLAIEAIW